jgi:hypothetical protein
MRSQARRSTTSSSTTLCGSSTEVKYWRTSFLSCSRTAAPAFTQRRHRARVAPASARPRYAPDKSWR